MGKGGRGGASWWVSRGGIVGLVGGIRGQYKIECRSIPCSTQHTVPGAPLARRSESAARHAAPPAGSVGRSSRPVASSGVLRSADSARCATLRVLNCGCAPCRARGGWQTACRWCSPCPCRRRAQAAWRERARRGAIGLHQKVGEARKVLGLPLGAAVPPRPRLQPASMTPGTNFSAAATTAAQRSRVNVGRSGRRSSGAGPSGGGRSGVREHVLR